MDDAIHDDTQNWRATLLVMEYVADNEICNNAKDDVYRDNLPKDETLQVGCKNGSSLYCVIADIGTNDEADCACNLISHFINCIHYSIKHEA